MTFLKVQAGSTSTARLPQQLLSSSLVEAPIERATHLDLFAAENTLMKRLYSAETLFNSTGLAIPNLALNQSARQISVGNMLTTLRVENLRPTGRIKPTQTGKRRLRICSSKSRQNMSCHDADGAYGIQGTTALKNKTGTQLLSLDTLRGQSGYGQLRAAPSRHQRRRI